MLRLGRLPRIGLLIVALAGLVSSCAPVLHPAGPPIGPARLAADALVTADGQRLPLSVWLPRGQPRAVVVALHGFNDYRAAFEEPAKALAVRGIVTLAYDQRGFGGSADRGYWPGEATLGDDLVSALRLAKMRYPDLPLYLLGESMGGAVAMVTMSRADAPAVDGVILAAPAVWGRASMSLLQQGALWLASHTLPGMTLTGRGLNIQASDNLEMLRRLSRDPLVIKETRVDAIHGLCDLMDDASAAAPRLSRRVMMLYGEQDQVVPADPSLAVMSALPDQPVPPVLALYAAGYHMLLRDLEAPRVIGDIASFILDPGAPLPSGADLHARERLAGRGPTD
jgi:alpha-beta hydrolase superfamily lysophospholipase